MENFQINLLELFYFSVLDFVMHRGSICRRRTKSIVVIVIVIVINGNVTQLSSENLEQLSAQQQSEILSLLGQFDGVFSDKPGRTVTLSPRCLVVPSR